MSGNEACEFVRCRYRQDVCGKSDVVPLSSNHIYSYPHTWRCTPSPHKTTRSIHVPRTKQDGTCRTPGPGVLANLVNSAVQSLHPNKIHQHTLGRTRSKADYSAFCGEKRPPDRLPRGWWKLVGVTLASSPGRQRADLCAVTCIIVLKFPGLGEDLNSNN